jgi:UDP-N-acetylglucosamine--N-acetylmuramyl-(pentapeptide) pyrophosphoryl-undecaprenol N-acetylglucosamine transferase
LRSDGKTGGPFAVIAGGGTAGHVLPALAIGRALVGAGHPGPTIHFVGSRRGIEGRLVPAAGFPLTQLPGRGVTRRFSWQGVAAVAGLSAATLRALWLIGRHRPAVVVSVGGYASVPCTLAAIALRVPLVVAEQNAVPGAANRLAARFARASAVSFAGTDLPRAEVTGNPVRAEVVAIDHSPAGRAEARRALGLPVEGKVVAAFGGSLGARRINEAVLELASSWRSRSGLAIRHIVGERDWPSISGRLVPPEPGGLVYQAVRYDDRMDLVYAAADVAVCRAGASTVAELAVAGLPAVLVPLPGAPGDHQTANARALAGSGAARLVPDDEADAGRLSAELDALLADDAVLAGMSRAARAAGHPDAAQAVAALIERHARPLSAGAAAGGTP